MVEFYYWREGSGGAKSRLECVVLFLPDVWSAQPSRIEWTTVQDQYKATCENAAKKLDAASPESSSEQAPDAAAEPGDVGEQSQIVCSQFCLVMFPAACSTIVDGDVRAAPPTSNGHNRYFADIK